MSNEVLAVRIDGGDLHGSLESLSARMQLVWIRSTYVQDIRPL